MPQQEIITRRLLPHWFVPGTAHFITYRLYGTLPQTALDDLKLKKEKLLSQKPKPGFTLAQQRSGVHKILFGIYDGLLDRGCEIRWLADPRIAAIVRSNLYHHHGSKYMLLAYCIMSNHVHVLLQPIDPADKEQAGRLHHESGSEQAGRLHHESGSEQAGRLHHESGLGCEMPVGESSDAENPLSSIMHSLKSYTAHEANKILKRSGTFWQSESYDHWVRDEDELERIVNYIAGNPVKAGLVEKPHEWFFCSAHDRFLTDGERTGWLNLIPIRSAGGPPA